MTRMRGTVGFDEDIRPLLARERDIGWLEARAAVEDDLAPRRAERTLPERELADLIEEDSVRAWVADGCPKRRGEVYVRFFAELDAWTEYWDVFHPETQGRYYFGDDHGNPGYLDAFLPSPRTGRSIVFDSWKSYAVFEDHDTGPVLRAQFEDEARRPAVVEAVLAVDELMRGLVTDAFGSPDGQLDALAYLDALARFGADCLPENLERFNRLEPHDGRKSSARHHTIEGDLMWFCWGTHLECAALAAAEAGSSTKDAEDAAAARDRRALMMAGVALGCASDFGVRKRRRTRSEYESGNAASNRLLWERALAWTHDQARAAKEVRDLFRIREYGL